MEQLRALRGAFAEQLQQALAQCHAGRFAEGEEGVQRAAAGGFGGFAGGPSNSPAASAASRSRIESPMATPQRGLRPARLKMPSGRFCKGKSACPLAEATQLRVGLAGSWGYLRCGLKVDTSDAQQAS